MRMSGLEYTWPDKKLPPCEGLNGFGFFDYSDKGVLRTPQNEMLKEFMMDKGVICMDCEMVGVGSANDSALARVSIANEYGFCLYDKFVRPTQPVTDYRTPVSGIREEDLKNASAFNTVRFEVTNILQGHILIGHGIKNDLRALNISHPKKRLRDTAYYCQWLLKDKHTPKLKTAVEKFLDITIQDGEHSSITDAQATMALYLLWHEDWENYLRHKNRRVDIFRKTLDDQRKLREN